MKKISLKELIKKINEQDSKRIRQFEVRELEAEKANCYTAFVDDGSESYDVSIQLNKQEVVAHGCDCGSDELFCLHQKAVAMALTKMDNTAGTKKINAVRKKKKSALESFLDEQDIVAVKGWLLSYLKDNKEAAAAFKLAFEEQRQSYDGVEVSAKLDELVNSVIGRKRRAVPAADIKKITDLWVKAIEPMEQYMEAQITTAAAGELFDVLVRRVYHYECVIDTNSKRIKSFFNKLIENFAGYINRLKSESDWLHTVTPIFSEYIGLGQEDWTVSVKCISIYNTAVNRERKDQLAGILKDKVSDKDFDEARYSSTVLLNTMRILENSGLFKDCVDKFKPRRYNDEYNKLYLHALSKVNPLRAVDECQRLIEDGHLERLDLFFSVLLEELYEQLGMLEKFNEMRIARFEFDPSVDLYIEIVESFTDSVEQEGFRQSVYRRLRAGYGTTDILLAIINYEDDWLEAFTVLKKEMYIYEYWVYKDKLYAADPMKLLSMLLYQSHISAAYYQHEYPQLFEEVPAFIQQNYSFTQVKKAAPARGFSKHTFGEYIVKLFMHEFFD